MVLSVLARNDVRCARWNLRSGRWGCGLRLYSPIHHVIQSSGLAVLAENRGLLRVKPRVARDELRGRHQRSVLGLNQLVNELSHFFCRIRIEFSFPGLVEGCINLPVDATDAG